MTAVPMTAPPRTALPRVAAAAHIPFRRLLLVEWRKGIDTRAARWLLLAVAVLTVGAVAIPVALPSEVDQTLSAYSSFAALGLAMLLPVVSILTLTSEWSQRTVLVTFTQEPRRSRVMAAKITCGLALGLAGAVFAAAVTAGALAVSEALNREVTWRLGWAPVVGFVAFALINTLMGMAFGALLHNTAAAIVLFYVLPTTWSLIAIGALERVGEWLDTSKTFSWVLTGDWDGHWGPILTSAAVWIVIPLVIGLIRTVRREVK
jgi:ABC-2 type transport system permease protein